MSDLFEPGQGRTREQMEDSAEIIGLCLFGIAAILAMLAVAAMFPWEPR